MNCPNCKIPFTLESKGKFHCETCGWFENVDDEWHVCEAPEPDPVALEPDPVALEPDPATRDPSLGPHVKTYLGGIVSVTEVDE